jgi:hypothetical protein
LAARRVQVGLSAVTLLPLDRPVLDAAAGELTGELTFGELA